VYRSDLIKIPRLCRNTALLRIVLATELFALVITLVTSETSTAERLGLNSVYLQWVALSSTALLCWFRTSLNRAKPLPRILGVLLIYGLCFSLTEAISQSVSGSATFDWVRFAQHAAIMMIVVLVVMQLFVLITELDQRGRVESEARVQALQSRIRPHFLFNSLNTIAELTATEPVKAEEAIDSLSLLFRAGLESDKRFHSLASELNLCERYLGLERWRLDDRLQVDWHVDLKNPPAYDVPKLILQPLIENAVVHGELEDGRVCLSIDVRETTNDLSIVVENGRSASRSNSAGHGIALDNIRERLIVLYDDRQTFRVREESQSYRVLMRFPKRRPASVD
jgi:two-component system sensor histidine kinase AlgZ